MNKHVFKHDSDSVAEAIGLEDLSKEDIMGLALRVQSDSNYVPSPKDKLIILYLFINKQPRVTQIVLGEALGVQNPSRLIEKLWNTDTIEDDTYGIMLLDALRQIAQNGAEHE